MHRRDQREVQIHVSVAAGGGRPGHMPAAGVIAGLSD